MMKIAFFNTKRYDQIYFDLVNKNYGFELVYFETRLTPETANLASGFDIVCVFVNDILNKKTLETLQKNRIKLIALRCAGFNNVDLITAKGLDLTVVRVPAYSPHAVAEHTIALLLGINRKLHRAYYRVREGNFALDGLIGFDIFGLTAGIIGTGKIGEIVASILKGFGCSLLAFDIYKNPSCEKIGVKYVELHELYARSDIISLHCPLTPDTHHIINSKALSQMRNGVTIVNTSRGALIDTKAVIQGLKSGKIGYLALDVYEEEGDLFFEDLSTQVIQDDVFARLLTFPNVFITGHQAFFTKNALQNIAETTLQNIQQFQKSKSCKNEISLAMYKK
jgi:D-lactate dehydrogenase